MPDHFLNLSLADRAEILQAVSPATGFLPHVLEKDVWICWVLQKVFAMPGRLPLAFKGGTSLSKVFGAISRFSEDIDLTIDYTALSGGEDPLFKETSNAAIKRLTEKLRVAVAEHVRTVIAPHLVVCGREQLNADLQMEIGSNGEELRIRYPSAFAIQQSYLQDSVLLEFGGRNTTLPNETHTIVPYAAKHVASLIFPVSTAVVLSPLRTFWEKATLIHSECHRPISEQRHSIERISRHWSDLASLVGSKIGTAALQDQELLVHVVKLKRIFFKSGFANYSACLERKFRLIPEKSLQIVLEKDYAEMVRAGMFIGIPPVFATVLEQLTALEAVLNQRR
jgi:hypothetical protein